MSGEATWPDTGDGAAESTGNLLRSIGEVSRLTGVSRGMLRLWERERLINPTRTPGGHRLYSSDDLLRLRQIVHLRRVDRLNMAAIRRELGMAEGTTPPSGPKTPSEWGQRLRALRIERQWSLTEVAEKSGLSVSFLSAVERGQSSISVASLFKLADAYGTTVPGLSPNYQSHHRSLLHPRERPRYVAGGAGPDRRPHCESWRARGTADRDPTGRWQ